MSTARIGMALSPKDFSATDRERFWKYVEIKTENECWEWRGCTANIYGTFAFGRRKIYAHRASYALTKELPAGLTVDHLCFNRVCVNPSHLEAVSTGENSRRFTRTITHCPHGHEYNLINTYHYNGHRHCRTCIKNRSKIIRAKKREAL